MIQITTGGFLKVVDGNVTVSGTGTFATVNCTDEDNILQVDGTTILRKGASANENLFIGHDAGNDTLTGDKNFGIGKGALKSLTTGGQNVVMGWEAGGKITVGSYNFALGGQSLWNNVTGDYNVAIGRSAGIAVVTNNNVMIGDQAGGGLGGASVAIGSQALKEPVGDNNVAIGYYAGKGATGGTVSDSTFIGRSAGQAINDGDENTFIGYASGYRVTDGEGNILIGHKSGFRQTTNSNLLIIDNQDRGSAANEAAMALIYGVFAPAAVDQDLTFNANVFLTQIKLGSDQANAGAAANEIWKTSGHASLPDNVLMIGV